MLSESPCLHYELVSAGHLQISSSTIVHDPPSVQFAAFTMAGDTCPCTCRFLYVSLVETPNYAMKAICPF